MTCLVLFTKLPYLFRINFSRHAQRHFQLQSANLVLYPRCQLMAPGLVQMPMSIHLALESTYFFFIGFFFRKKCLALNNNYLLGFAWKPLPDIRLAARTTTFRLCSITTLFLIILIELAFFSLPLPSFSKQ